MPDPPPHTITPAILSLVAEIAGEVGWLGALQGPGKVPMLRRENRIRSIHASLAIENNTLSLDQVTAVLSGKRVLGPPSEIQEVKNAFSAYEAMPALNPSSTKDLLSAHRLMLEGLVADAGKFRSRAVGIAQGKQIVHLAPPANLVPGLMKKLLGWLKRTDAHPLVSSCVFHYELEFIHPFADGNGRIGRLWQTLILSHWNPLFAFADRIEARLAVAQKTVDRLTTSVLAKAFRGELVPQDPTDEPASTLLERHQSQPAAKPAKAKRP